MCLLEGQDMINPEEGEKVSLLEKCHNVAFTHRDTDILNMTYRAAEI